MEMSGPLHTLVAFTLGNNPWYPLYRELGDTENQSGRCGEDKNLLPLLGIEPQISIVQSIVRSRYGLSYVASEPKLFSSRMFCLRARLPESLLAEATQQGLCDVQLAGTTNWLTDSSSH
jgi:hypothetical protein